MTKAMMAFLLASVLATASVASAADHHEPAAAATKHDAHEAHASPHTTAITPPHGERWPTDEFLRTGMSRIQTAVEQAGDPSALSAERSAALGRTIERNVADIVEHCKLPPEADAALHVVIARMMAASHQLKENDSPDAAVAQVRSALRDYRDAFDHSPAISPHSH